MNRGDGFEDVGSVADRIRVLHVDDDAGFTTLVSRFLEREDDDIEVISAESPETGLRYLRDESIDCVVSDYEMPETDGLAFLERIREEHPSLPFVLFTGKGNEEIASEAISAGVTEYLQKSNGSEQYSILANRIRNIVEGDRSRRELQRRTRRMERLVANLPGMVYRCRNDADWTMTFVGGDCEDLCGYSAADLEADRVSWGSDVLHPDDRKDAWVHVQAALEADEPFELTYRIVDADGETRWVWERGQKTGTDGEFVELEGFITDISDRKRHEEKLRRTGARLNALFDNSPDMIDVHDERGTLVDVNDRLCETLGYDESELVGRKVWEVDQNIDPDTATKLWTSMSTGDRRRLEGEYRRKDGTTFPVEIHLVRAEIEGDDRFVVISRDISDRKERERRLREQNERLEAFASVVSHDLRNPLNVAEGRLELVREECDSEHLDGVERALGRMDALVGDLLTLAREDTDAADTEPLDLATVVRQCWYNVDTSDATLTVADDATIRADNSRVKQLLENLFRNAIEHGGDDVAVEVGTLENGFYVADDGPGIAETDCERVFEDGYSTSAEGTGLGLSIVRRIADAHGWEVRLTASETGGARVELTGVELG